MTKVIVTGGAGFIGSHLTDELVRQGYKVIILDNLSTGRMSNIEPFLGKAGFVQGSVTDLPLLRKLFSGIDYVFHQAAIPSVPRSVRNPRASHSANITGTLNVLLAARDNGVKKVVYASSSSVYGESETLPKVEDMTPTLLQPGDPRLTWQGVVSLQRTDKWVAPWRLPYETRAFYPPERLQERAQMPAGARISFFSDTATIAGRPIACGDVADTVRREHMSFFQYMLRELGTSGTMDGRRVLFKGRVVKKNIEDKLESFMEAYVYCQECRSPDTRLVREGRTTVLRCDACGGHRPVAVRKQKRASTREQHALQEGKVYEVLIEDIGKKGDGVAKLGNYTVFVTGAPKGAEMRILIEKVTGNIAYAKPYVE